MRSVLRLADKTLTWQLSTESDLERRPLGANDPARFHAWADRYRKALVLLRSADELEKIGRELYEWLDGGERWLARPIQEGVVRPPWRVELSVPGEPLAEEHAFLGVPWELAARPGGPLALDESFLFCPVRRFGPIQAEAPPSLGRLKAVFMAAQPEGQAELDFDREEAGILAATRGVGLELRVEDSGSLEPLGALVAHLEPVEVVHLSCHGAATPQPHLLLEDEVGDPVAATAQDLDAALQPHRPQLLFLSACETAAADQVFGSLAGTLVRCPATISPVRWRQLLLCNPIELS